MTAADMGRELAKLLCPEWFWAVVPNRASSSPYYAFITGQRRAAEGLICYIRREVDLARGGTDWRKEKTRLAVMAIAEELNADARVIWEVSLPGAGEQDWRPGEMVPEDFYAM